MPQQNLGEQLYQLEKLTGSIMAIGGFISGVFAIILFVIRSKFVPKEEFEKKTEMLTNKLNEAMLGHERATAQMELIKSDSRRLDAAIDNLNKNVEHTNNNIKEYANKNAVFVEKFMALEDRMEKNEEAILRQGEAINRIQEATYEVKADVKAILAAIEAKNTTRRRI
jgi:chromosome segregation ATPase